MPTTKKRKKKRGNNEGCIRKRPNGLWEAQYLVAKSDDGKSIRRSLYGKTKQEVQEKLHDTLLQLRRDEYVPPSRLTVGEWLDEWFAVYCLTLKRNSTCTGYEDEINLHLKPYVGRILLQDLRAQNVQAAVNALVKSGKAASTVRKAYTILHAALEQALINQMLLHNPSQHTILPKMEQPEIRFFTLSEQKRFIDPFYMVYISEDGEVVCNHLSPKDMLDRMRLLCKGKDCSAEEESEGDSFLHCR